MEGAQDQRAYPDEQEALEDADFDTLATALYVRTDDLLKASPDRAPWRPKVGIAPKISDAELITLAVMQALLGHTSEARWLRYTRSHLQHLFRYLPKQPGYNKRLRRLPPIWPKSDFHNEGLLVDGTRVRFRRACEALARCDIGDPRCGRGPPNR